MEKISAIKVRLLLVLLVLFRAVFAKRGDPCTLPNGKKATCKPARLCHFIVIEIRKGNREAVNFVRKSECGYDEEQLVCCGSFSFLSTSTLRASSKSLEDFTHTQLPDRTACGFEETNYRNIREETDFDDSVAVLLLYGGEETNLSELPWVAALEYNRKISNEYGGVQCAGSVINTRYVLTAAHCLGSSGLDLIGVLLGEWHVNSDPDCLPLTGSVNPLCADPVQRFKIEKTIPHRFYDRDSGDNDIGLIKLDRDVKFSRYVRPICLPFPDIFPSSPGTLMTVSGWETMDDKGTRSRIKLKVEVPLVSNNDCTKISRYQTVSSNQVCAGGERGKDACNGDSGGPLMVPHRDQSSGKIQWYQEGIVAWGSGCAFQKPSIYTRVSKYIKWIVRNISE